MDDNHTGPSHDPDKADGLTLTPLLGKEGLGVVDSCASIF